MFGFLKKSGTVLTKHEFIDQVTPDVVANFLFKPLERYWVEFEPTLKKVKKDLNFIMGFFKTRGECPNYELETGVAYAQKFNEHVVRLTVPKNADVTQNSRDHVFTI